MIAITALREKVRKKIYIAIFIVSGIITLLFSTSNTTIMIGGEYVTDYSILFSVMMIALNAVSCAMAAVISLGTVPNEYERKTHHLILTRGISQARFHGELTAANVMASLISHGIFFIGAAVYMTAKDHSSDLIRLIPAYLVSGIGIAIVSTFTTWLSVILPKFASGLIAAAVTISGVCYPLLKLLKSVAGGFAGQLLKGLLFVLPDIHSIQLAGSKIITEGGTDIHIIFTGLFYTYIFAMGILLCKRKAE